MQNQLQEQPPQPVDQPMPKHLDPMFDTLFRAMKQELQEKEKKVEELQQELLATNFTPYSIPSKKLLTKLRALQQENEELGKQLCQGKVEQLHVELALQKRAMEDLKASLDESNRLIANLDNEAEMLQAQVFKLQARLKDMEQATGRDRHLSEAEDDPVKIKDIGPRDRVGGEGTNVVEPVGREGDEEGA